MSTAPSNSTRRRWLSGAGFAGLGGIFGMGGATLAQGRLYECLTRDHESLREIGGGG